jgi:small subunit ribosomal protein S14
MAKKSMIEKNEMRRRLAKKYSGKRDRLRAIVHDKKLPIEERFAATLKLAKVPRNSAKGRIRNRCELTGRPRGTFRKFGLARGKIREAAMRGDIPGLIKASW